jgi:putative acetyltransferase
LHAEFAKKEKRKPYLEIRRANTDDTAQICRLFYDTVTNVNNKDYTPGQIEIWAAKYKDTERWKAKINEQNFFVAELDGKITGFGSITDKGYLDYMYVHKDHQGQGIATELLKVIEQTADELQLKEIWAEVSITARPFFKSKGFGITKLFTTNVNGIEFEDSIMKKNLER